MRTWWPSGHSENSNTGVTGDAVGEKRRRRGALPRFILSKPLPNRRLSYCWPRGLPTRHGQAGFDGGRPTVERSAPQGEHRYPRRHQALMAARGHDAAAIHIGRSPAKGEASSTSSRMPAERQRSSVYRYVSMNSLNSCCRTSMSLPSAPCRDCSRITSFLSAAGVPIVS